MTFLILITSVLILFGYCFNGKVATDSYENMAGDLNDCNWQDLPMKYQKYLIVMMADAQQPLYYHGFGVIGLKLEIFTTVRILFQ